MVPHRQVNQAVARHPDKFGDTHSFRLTDDEVVELRSQDVIPKAGRGGSRTPPRVFTQKGIARLATVLKAPKALEATDQIIDLFLAVHAQIAAGANAVTVDRPDRLVQPPALAERVAEFKVRLLDQLDGLMNTPVPGGAATVRDEVSDTVRLLVDDVKARLKKRTLENEKLEAETLKILAEVDTLHQRRLDDARKARAEAEGMELRNIQTRIGIVRETLAMLEDLEPSAAAELNADFVALRLTPPRDDR